MTYPRRVSESHVTEPLLTPRFARAVTFAGAVHANQVRKGTDIPYLAHLMAVAALVLEAGGDEDCAIAAILHDAVEDSVDGKAMTGRIRKRFGERVSAIVAGCSDAVAVPGLPKSDWRPRKEAYLRRLKVEGDIGVLLVSACDKLHNVRAIVSDLAKSGQVVWSRFTVGKESQLWYYGSLSEVYKIRAKNFAGGEQLAPIANELAKVVAEMQSLANS